MDKSSCPQTFNPGWSVPEVGPRSEILDAIKRRKTQLKFRRTVLLKRQQFRMRVPDVQEEEVQVPELAVIASEIEDLTAKQRELGYFEDDDLSQSATTPELPVTEENIHWPPPPPCILVSDANKVVPIAVKELGRKPAVTECPSCGEIVTTKTAKKRGDATWLLCCLSAIFGCIGGCCLIPFCVGSLKDVHHSCPTCQTQIYIREKI
ncbi:unnamed protein product [Lota lota]